VLAEGFHLESEGEFLGWVDGEYLAYLSSHSNQFTEPTDLWNYIYSKRDARGHALAGASKTAQKKWEKEVLSEIQSQVKSRFKRTAAKCLWNYATDKWLYDFITYEANHSRKAFVIERVSKNADDYRQDFLRQMELCRVGWPSEIIDEIEIPSTYHLLDSAVKKPDDFIRSYLEKNYEFADWTQMVASYFQIDWPDFVLSLWSRQSFNSYAAYRGKSDGWEYRDRKGVFHLWMQENWDISNELLQDFADHYYRKEFYSIRWNQDLWSVKMPEGKLVPNYSEMCPAEKKLVMKSLPYRKDMAKKYLQSISDKEVAMALWNHYDSRKEWDVTKIFIKKGFLTVNDFTSEEIHAMSRWNLPSDFVCSCPAPCSWRGEYESKTEIKRKKRDAYSQMELFDLHQTAQKDSDAMSVWKEKTGGTVSPSEVASKNRVEFFSKLQWVAQDQRFFRPIAYDVGTHRIFHAGMTQEEKDLAVEIAEMPYFGWYDLRDGTGGWVDFTKDYEAAQKEVHEVLSRADLLIGYNSDYFDSRVLKANGFDLDNYPNIRERYDLMASIYSHHAVPVREKLDTILRQNGLGFKDKGSDRAVAAFHDAQATAMCFLKLTLAGLDYGKTRMITSIAEGINTLREMKSNPQRYQNPLLSLLAQFCSEVPYQS
jgi:hypothetical protein